MDDRIFLALVSSISSLLGALIGATVAIYSAHLTTMRELKKERLARANTLALEKVAPQILDPILRVYREYEHGIAIGLSPILKCNEIRDILEKQRFLALLAPTRIRYMLDRIWINTGIKDTNERTTVVHKDLKRLELIISDVYATYRLEESVGGNSS